MVVILADAEKEYVEALLDQLAGSLPSHVQLIGCCSWSSWPDSTLFQGERQGLCLFNPVDFPDLPQKSARSNPALAFTFWSMRPGLPEALPDGAPESQRGLFRLDPASMLVRRILHFMESCQTVCAAMLAGSQPMAPASASRLTASVARLNQPVAGDADSDRIPRIYLLLSVESSGYRPEISRLRLRELVGSGLRVIYLPIMPTYQMYCLSPPSRGPSMSDLLLALLGQNLNPDHLVQYLQPHPDGYLQFRPPDRSDDLVLCNPDMLRQLVALLRTRLFRGNEPYVVLIDCAGVPLSSVACIAVLCDSCEICLPEKECFAAQAARREVSYLLALLPPGCQVKENGQMKTVSDHPALSWGAVR